MAGADSHGDPKERAPYDLEEITRLRAAAFCTHFNGSSLTEQWAKRSRCPVSLDSYVNDGLSMTHNYSETEFHGLFVPS